MNECSPDNCAARERLRVTAIRPQFIKCLLSSLQFDNLLSNIQAPCLPAPFIPISCSEEPRNTVSIWPEMSLISGTSTTLCRWSKWNGKQGLLAERGGTVSRVTGKGTTCFSCGWLTLVMDVWVGGVVMAFWPCSQSLCKGSYYVLGKRLSFTSWTSIFSLSDLQIYFFDSLNFDIVECVLI